ncbi:MAG: sensor histidine kinase [Desulfobulbus sp.]|jgi:two-component system NtrC family sensor kinase
MSTTSPRSHRLTQQLTAGFFVCAIIPVIIIAAASINNFRQLSINDITLRACQLVEDKAEAINVSLHNQIRLLEGLSNLYDLESLGQEENFNRLAAAIDQASGKNMLVDVQLIAANGSQLAYIGPYQDQKRGTTYQGEQWFTNVLAQGTHVSDVFTDFGGHPRFAIALTDSMKTSVLRATINSAIFNSILHNAQIGPNGDAYILNAKGERQTPGLQKNGQADPVGHTMLNHHAETKTFLDNGFLYASRWLDGDRWLLVVKTQVADSLTGFYDYRNRIILITAAAALFLLLSAFGIARFLVQRIERIDQEQVVINEQMAHIEKMANIGRLAAGIAHEINNPLQLIQMQAGWIGELLEEENPEHLANLEEYRNSISRIRQHVERAGTITRRLLGFSRKLSARGEVDLNELIHETISFLQSEARSNNITIALDLAPSLPSVHTDGSLVQQVLLNLIKNSLDAVGAGGQVDIHTMPSATHVSVQIGDNGPGIKPEVLEKIWEPFFTTKETGKGTGLGLSIVHDIANKLGGTVQVENRASGGAMFTFTLPIQH